jgi:oligopeptide transport system permease protein
MATVRTAARPIKTEAALGALVAGRPSRSLWSNAWRQFTRNKLAMVGLTYIALLCIVAIFAPAFAPHNPVQTDVKVAGQYRQAAWIQNPNPMKSGNWEYPLGTDAVGRDVLSRIIYGARVSLIVGFIPMVVIMVIGVPLGLAAGFGSSRLDNLLMRFTDVVYAFPSLLFFIIMQTALHDTRFGQMLNGLVLLFVTLSIVSWTGVTRLVRGETLALREKEFVEAAQTCGASTARIISRHILPNAMGPLIVAGAFIVPGAIISEAILGYLGIGTRPSAKLDNPFPASWGPMLLDGSSSWQSQPWTLIAPAIAVALITIAFTFVGDGLRDALDPRQQL